MKGLQTEKQLLKSHNLLTEPTEGGEKLEPEKMHLQSNLVLKQCCTIYAPNVSLSADIL